MKSTYSVIFYMKKEKARKDGTYPIFGRITIDGAKSHFSCKIYCKPDIWEVNGGHAIGKSLSARNVNTQLDAIRGKINDYYDEIMRRDGYVTAEKLRNAYQGLEFRYNSIMTVFEQFNEDYEKQVFGGLKSATTLRKYKAVYKHLGEFLQMRFHVSDLSLKEIKPSFISDFEIFLSVDKKLKHNSVCRYVKPVMMLLHRAQENGWIVRYPFSDYQIYEEEPDKGFVTKEEMQMMMNYPKLNTKRTFVRDLFIFCCFTGISYIDLKNLTHDNLVVNPADGSKWIHYRRQKTGVEADVKLLEVPLKIIEKYDGLCDDGHVFKVPAFYSCCSIIRTVAKLCGIDKHLTWHQARHSMATVVCLSNGMPIEVVSSVLGHKNIESTQIYAKITKEKLGCEMDKLSKKLKSIPEFKSCKHIYK